MNHTLSNHTDFAIRIGSAGQFTYYNRTSVQTNIVSKIHNSSIPLMDVDTIEIYYRQNSTSKDNTFSINFTRVTCTQIVAQFTDVYSWIVWVFISILILVGFFIVFYAYCCCREDKCAKIKKEKLVKLEKVQEEQAEKAKRNKEKD